MNILALDLAGKFGWAYGPTDSTRPTCGSIELRKPLGGHGAIGAGFLKWIDAFTQAAPVDVLVIEREMRVGAVPMSHEAHRVLIGLVFLAESVADLRGFRKVILVDAQAARKHFLGQRTFQAEKNLETGKVTPSRTIAKNAVMARCRMLGIEPKDHDAADAVACWFYGAGQVNPRMAHATTPLFGGGNG